MKVQQFLSHYGLKENPFGQEDAQSDHVLRDHLLDSGTHHPAWDKIFGRPDNPSTAVVFGEKGAGKTALRLQITEKIRLHNRGHRNDRVFVIEYDDFNPFLDNFRTRLTFGKRVDKAISKLRLWDHMDAILSLGVRRLVKAILQGGGVEERDGISLTPEQINQLTHLQRRDVLLLAAFYDNQHDQPRLPRWHALREKLGYSRWPAMRELLIGVGGTLLLLMLIVSIGGGWGALLSWWSLLFIAPWFLWLKRQAVALWLAYWTSRQIRVFNLKPNTTRAILTGMPASEVEGQPMPDRDHSDDRYELFQKFQAILRVLGYKSVMVVVDRVDEPHLVNGLPERMRDLLWPMFDNKFLKHPGLCFKMLLPAEVVYFLNREEKAFYDRSRLDKQNLITSLEWSGESLYDVANDRIRVCTDRSGPDAPEKPIPIKDWFEDRVTEQELYGIFSRMRVPRHLFKFLHRLIVDHCNRYSEEQPVWTINRDTLQTVLAIFLRDLEAFDRGMGTG